MPDVHLMKVKWCWVATPTAKGWRLKLTMDRKGDVPLSGVLFASIEEVKRVVRGGLVLVHRKTTTTKTKVTVK